MTLFFHGFREPLIAFVTNTLCVLLGAASWIRREELEEWGWMGERETVGERKRKGLEKG